MTPIKLLFSLKLYVDIQGRVQRRLFKHAIQQESVTSPFTSTCHLRGINSNLLSPVHYVISLFVLISLIASFIILSPFSLGFLLSEVCKIYLLVTSLFSAPATVHATTYISLLSCYFVFWVSKYTVSIKGNLSENKPNLKNYSNRESLTN